jgi:hypothetical protein
MGGDAVIPISGWIEKRDEETGFAFSYPPYLDSEYARFVDWPPALSLVRCPFPLR